jgi:hypothetical protein
MLMVLSVGEFVMLLRFLRARRLSVSEQGSRKLRARAGAVGDGTKSCGGDWSAVESVNLKSDEAVHEMGVG